MGLRATFVFFLLGLFFGAHASPPVLQLPLQCRPGIDCHIQNYVDHDPGPGWRDYACGFLSYDGHSGTDFRVASVRAMEHGVFVVAAADGLVTAVRDGEPDTPVSVRGRTALRGKDAGNAVRIAHDDGWETQYSHLKRNSVLVRPGQAVSRGTRLGQVGMSGNAEFPHVEVTVRHLGKAVDPFAPAGASAESCARPANTLWDPALASVLAYRPTGLLIAGFSPGKPDRRQAQMGAYDSRSLPKDAAAIVFWLELYGVRNKDILRLRLEGPNGSTLAHGETPIPGNKAAWFEFVGKRRSESFWQSGEYLGHFGLWRNGELLLERHFKASVD